MPSKYILYASGIKLRTQRRRYDPLGLFPRNYLQKAIRQKTYGGGFEARRTVGVALLGQPKSVHAAWLLILLLGGRATLGVGLRGLRAQGVGEVEDLTLACARRQPIPFISLRVRAGKMSRPKTTRRKENNHVRGGHNTKNEGKYLLLPFCFLSSKRISKTNRRL